jgi:hypothetical protein
MENSQLSSSATGITSVADLVNQEKLLFINDLIEDAVVTSTHLVQACPTSFQWLRDNHVKIEASH